jgi:hypothetical protein
MPFDAREKSFEFAQDSAKQLITLSSAIVALTITFFKDFASGASTGSKVLMMVAWALYLLSISFGLMHLFALTGALAAKAPSIKEPSAKTTSGIQQILFLGALLVTAVSGAIAISHTATPSPNTPAALCSASTSPTSTPPPPKPAPHITPTSNPAPRLSPSSPARAPS